jgi:hypothetical protein
MRQEWWEQATTKTTSLLWLIQNRAPFLLPLGLSFFIHPSQIHRHDAIICLQRFLHGCWLLLQYLYELFLGLDDLLLASFSPLCCPPDACQNPGHYGCPLHLVEWLFEDSMSKPHLWQVLVFLLSEINLLLCCLPFWVFSQNGPAVIEIERGPFFGFVQFLCLGKLTGNKKFTNVYSNINL